jgi:hypothetical protein
MVADCFAATALINPERWCPELRQWLKERADQDPEKRFMRDRRVAAIAAATHLLSDTHPAVVAEFDQCVTSQPQMLSTHIWYLVTSYVLLPSLINARSRNAFRTCIIGR